MLRRFSLAWFGLLLAAVLAASLSGVPMASAVDDDVVESTGNENTKKGSASAYGVAFKKADETNKPVEVTTERSADTRVFVNPDGTLSQQVSQSPLFAKDDDGDFKPIDADLTRDGARLEPTLTTPEVSFSATGSGPVSALKTASGKTVSFSLLDGSLGTPQVSGDVATYERSGAGADESVRVSSTASGFTTHVVLGEKPTSQPVYRFKIDASGLDVALDGQVLTFKDGSTAVAQSRPLTMWDADVDAAGAPEEPVEVDAKLVEADGDTVLELRPSMSWLADADREYPVTIDPDLSDVPRKAELTGDTYFFEEQSVTDVRNEEMNLRVGSSDGSRKFRSLLTFRYKQMTAATITDAKLSLKQYHNGAVGCAEKTTYAYPMSGGDRLNATWGNQPGNDLNPRFQGSGTFNAGNDCGAARKEIDVTSIVNAWAGGQQTGDDAALNRQAIVLRAPSEYDKSQEKRFCSENWDSASGLCGSSTVVPTLTIDYEPEIGTQSWYSTTDHTFNDRSSLSINNRNGNATIQSTDATFTGVAQDLTVRRTYNSQATDANTSLGLGWNFGFGPDVWLAKKSQYRYDFHGPTATVLGSFLRKSSDSAEANYREFRAPVNGGGADLNERKNDDTGKYEFFLKFRKSPLRYKFVTTNSDGDAFLSQIYDRSGNHIDFTYSGFVANNKRPKLTQITDTTGRTYAVTYTGDRITQITEGTGRAKPGVARAWKYGYTNNKLTSYTDPTGRTWTYSYVGGDRITQITGPGSTSDQTITKLEYGGKGQATNVRYRYGAGTDTATDFQNWSFTYQANAPGACKPDDKAGFGTEVTDAEARTTTYCFSDRDRDGNPFAATVYDKLGNRKNMKYSADNMPTTQQSATDQTTTTSYSDPGANGSLGDRVTKVTQPKNDGAGSNGALSSGFEYGADSGESAYLPSTARDESNSCNAYEYDSSGRTTSTASGYQANASGSCSATKGNATSTFKRTYDDPTGNVLSSWDANAGSNPAAEDKTAYDYWKGGGTGYVSGSQNLLKSVRKPGGNCSSNPSDRKLCRSYTYDGAGRIASMTNGKGEVTTYAYDLNDRTTAVYYNGTGASSCSSTSSSCITYTYDDEGNLKTRTTNGQTTTMDYDRMNRQTLVTTPAGSNKTDSVAYAYDGANNVLGYTDLVDGIDSHQVEYGYDDANRPTSVKETFRGVSETTSITPDKNGRPTQIQFQKAGGTSAGARVNYSWANNGKPKDVKLVEGDGQDRGTITYGYRSGDKDTSQLQTRTVSGAAYADQNGEWDYDYDSKQRLSAANASGSGTDYAYDYDRIGNLTKETVGSQTTYFGYDMVGQLCFSRFTTAATSTPRNCGTRPEDAVGYTNDKAGNNLGTPATPNTVNDRNQVSSIDGRSQTYLDQGNDLRLTNQDNREISNTNGVSAIKNGSTVTFIVRSPDGTLLTNRKATAGGSGSTSRFNYITEPNGSVTWTVKDDGKVGGGYRYAPYGDSAAYGNTDATSNRFRWLGEQQNPDTANAKGSYKFGARYYDTRGHFTQPDPLSGGMADPRTMTSYAYAGGDPINQADASGYLTGEVSGKACYYLCLGVTYAEDDDGDKGLTPSIGLGAPGISAGPSVRTGDVSEGPSVPISCSAGPFGASYDFVSGSGGYSLSKASTPSCSLDAGYTFKL